MPFIVGFVQFSQTVFISMNTERFERSDVGDSGGLFPVMCFLFLPLNVSVKAWHIGQRILRLSIRLSLLMPLIWSRCNVSSFPFQVPGFPHHEHSFFSKLASKSLFFRLKML